MSKRPEMWAPDIWPSYYSKAKGCEVWDLDGKHYYDFSIMGVGANVLGYAFDEVDNAAKEAIDNGSMCTLNAPEEVAVAEKLLELHPWAGGVRYTKSGGEAMSMAARIAENAKIQRPGACNAIECILVHRSQARDFLPRLAQQLQGRVELRCDEESHQILSAVTAAPDASPAVKATPLVRASDADFGFEFLDLICAVKLVDNLEEAICYINAHSTHHSESICTNNRAHARAFQSQIDSACVYVNASTRFTDGGEFGFGAELGISTQKLHARGPMGIAALTTTKFLIDGDGQVR